MVNYAMTISKHKEMGSTERKNTTVAEIKPDARYNEDLLSQPGAERARLWEYHPNTEQWDDGKWSGNYVVIKMEKRPFADGTFLRKRNF